MKVLIMNAVFANGGDVAILMTLIQHLRKLYGEDVQITIAENQPEITGRFYQHYSFAPTLSAVILGKPRPGFLRLVWGLFRFGWWYLSMPRIALASRLLATGRYRLASSFLFRKEREAIQPMLEADLVVSSGGTYLVENYWLETRLLDFEVVLKLGKPLVLYTQSLGPYTKPKYKRQFDRLFNSVDLVLLRDERSGGYVEDLCGMLPHVHVLADAAFALAEENRLQAGDQSTWYERRGLKVAISVRKWPYFSGSNADGMAMYREAVIRLVEHLVEEENASVTFLSTCQGIPGYVFDDADEARRIMNLMPPALREKVILDHQFHQPDQLIEKLAGYDLMIATRMHAAILSLVAGIPVLPIAYEFKTRALFDRFGLLPLVADIGKMTPDILIENLQSLRNHPLITQGQLFDKVREQRDLANRALDLMRPVVSISQKGASEAGS